MGAEPKPWTPWKPSNSNSLRFRSPFRGSTGRAIKIILAALLLWHSLEVLNIYRRILSHSRWRPPKEPSGERVFIASLHWNDGKILEDSWNDAVVDLVEKLGRDNVYVSIYESGSWDRTKDMLRALDTVLADMGVRRQISFSDITYEDEIGRPHLGSAGWVDTLDGRKEKRRIPYLANLRNIHLKRLVELSDRGVPYDKILFLNDIYFQPEDAQILLETNGGNYAAACALDFNKTNTLFDTFAVRDAKGYEVMTKSWPYFRAGRSVSAMKHDEPVPVQSCWNGMVAMPTEPFTKNRIRFRAIPDSLAAYHVEGSEWCLLHADNPQHQEHEVFINPRVRVGYSTKFYHWAHRGGSWLSLNQISTGLWRNRVHRWFTSAWAAHHKVQTRVKAWRHKDEANQERGAFCLVDEMQVLRRNGWAHV